MSIPKNISKEHILLAIEEIDKSKVPDERKLTRFYLMYEGRHYPPKYVISLANKYANGYELPPPEFPSEKESYTYLSNLDFEITINEKDGQHISHSWSIISPIVAVKEMDKSSFLYNSTGIPFDIRRFFDIEGLGKGEKRRIIIIYNEVQYEASFIMDKLNNSRTKLQWSSSLANEIKQDFPIHYEEYTKKKLKCSLLKMKFIKYNNSEFDVYINEVEEQEFDVSPGEFNNHLFNKDFEVWKKKVKTKYSILTVKQPGNKEPIEYSGGPLYQTLVYRVLVLENSRLIETSYVYDRSNKNLLTPAKKEGIKLLLGHDPTASLKDITMTHYKQDRLTASPWEKEKRKTLTILFEQVKAEQKNPSEHIYITIKFAEILLYLDLIKKYNRNPTIEELRMMMYYINSYEEVNIFYDKLKELEFNISFKFYNGTLIYFIEDYQDCIEIKNKIYSLSQRRYKVIYEQQILLSKSKEQAIEVIEEAKRNGKNIEEEWSNKFSAAEIIKERQVNWKNGITPEEFNQFPVLYEKFLDMKDKYFNSFTLLELKEVSMEQQHKGHENIKKTEATVYYRSLVIKEYAKKVANGICQLCENNAPFKDRYGKPFLEIHHIQYLSKGGSDTIDNVTALCPNCHRKIHQLELHKDVEKIKEKALINFKKQF